MPRTGVREMLKNSASRPQVAIVTLGCAKNLVDAEVMAALLSAAGFALVTEPSHADAVVVNTCGFIAPAREESVAAIEQMARLKTRRCRAIVVAGCLAQRLGAEILSLPGVDAIVGTGELERLPDVLRWCLEGPGAPGEEDELPVPHGGDRRVWVGKPEVPLGLPRLLSTGATAYLKIAEGCDRACTFCIIPRLRGRYRSRPLPELVDEAYRLVETGVREMVLVAEDTSQYGRDVYGHAALPDLLRRLARIPGLHWIRILYAYPHLFPREAAAVMREEERILPYLDLPLQHISDAVLRRMGRPDRGDDIRRLLDWLREEVPGLVLRSTFMVGFPGETESDFRELMAFLRSYRLEHAGFFSFHPEEEAPASSFPDQVEEAIKKRRLEEAIACQEEMSLELNRRLQGRELEVLVEARDRIAAAEARPSGGARRRLLPRAIGRWAGQAPEVDGQVHVIDCSARVGEFVTARVEHVLAHDLVAVAKR